MLRRGLLSAPELIAVSSNGRQCSPKAQTIELPPQLMYVDRQHLLRLARLCNVAPRIVEELIRANGSSAMRGQAIQQRELSLCEPLDSVMIPGRSSNRVERQSKLGVYVGRPGGYGKTGEKVVNGALIERKRKTSVRSGSREVHFFFR